MTEQKNPAGANRRGLTKKAVVEEINTLNRIESQGFSAFPCVGCAYFKVVQLDSGRVRRLCQFSGEQLPASGVPGCVILRGDA